MTIGLQADLFCLDQMQLLVIADRDATATASFISKSMSGR